MKISVLISTYNSATTIVASIESVLKKTLQPDEIILLLDGGVDDTVDRLERFKPRVTVVIQKNHGVACARNRLTELASGDLLAFLDSDDVWHPEYLKSQYASKRREYAKALPGVGRTQEARDQLTQSLRNCTQLLSLLQSFSLLVASFLPKPLQPQWPSPVRMLNQTSTPMPSSSSSPNVMLP